MTQVARWIRGYDKTGEHLAREIRLPSAVPLSLLQQIFLRPHDDPMYECYPINAAVGTVLQTFLHEPVDFGEYEFMLECDAD